MLRLRWNDFLMSKEITKPVRLDNLDNIRDSHKVMDAIAIPYLNNNNCKQKGLCGWFNNSNISVVIVTCFVAFS